MITRIEVDGFKSLSDFTMNLEPGLNILVGPNGAGKTNIVLFFEFISNIVDSGLSEAFSRVGGAGSILKKIGENEYQNNIIGSISGKKKIVLGRYSKGKNQRKKNIKYSYNFNIELSPENVIYYKQQRLIIIGKDENKIFDVEQNTTFKLETTLSLHKFDEKMCNSHLLIYSKKKNNTDNEKMLKDYLQRFNLLSNSIFTTFLRILEQEYIYEIMADLKAGESFNIIPSEVKKPEDVAKSPGIQKNGSGLAATLYAMKRRSEREHLYSRYFFKHYYYMHNGLGNNVLSESNFKKIIDNVKLANDSITNIDVINEPFSNNLKVKISIKEEGGKEAILPLSQMSDGTIKWMTLITAIFTTRNIFSIEEPENFLHPWMQSEIVKIIRNNTRKDSFILMTTHSESLLNSAKPEEIILVYMNKGKTNAKRIKNIKNLRKGISKTGFGLGYFYFSNSIESK